MAPPIPLRALFVRPLCPAQFGWGSFPVHQQQQQRRRTALTLEQRQVEMERNFIRPKRQYANQSGGILGGWHPVKAGGPSPGSGLLRFGRAAGRGKMRWSAAAQSSSVLGALPPGHQRHDDH
ncbi:hypothetical protein CSOJ01_06098 [Colletotrichum sojae]|uniref:Uncharacterized protein n=1 Tax=Colletotrichum sojae TaxID=2175907 RepID=A0A8H6JDH7_9PEZI|nr:hypothetical protein CSOJ01_06098 [Colletotrichum sojae]